MPKRLALFIDGTWNGPDDPAITHVRRLYAAAKAADSSWQESRYLAGVGSHRGDGSEIPDYVIEEGLRSEPAWIRRPVNNLRSGVTGWGTDFNIRAAYRWLVAHFEPGDAVFLFGFSRGAFAARSLAGFIDIVGVLFKDDDAHISPLYDLYRQGPAGREELQAAVRNLAGRCGPFPRPGRQASAGNAGEIPVDDRDALRVYFIGVWDTVGAIRSSGWNPVARRAHHEIEMPDNVTHVRHALALHELRKPFEPELFEKPPKEPGGSLEQVWFAGAHADVGGGYEDESELSEVPLRWIAEEAMQKGLALVSIPKAATSMEPTRKLKLARGVHNSVSGRNCFFTPQVRQILWNPDPAAHPWAGRMTVHESAMELLLTGAMPGYAYFDRWANQALVDVDRASIRFAATLALLDRGPNSSGPHDPAQRLGSNRWWEKLSLKDLRGSFPVAGRVSLTFGKDKEPVDTAAWVADIQAQALVWLICPQRLLDRMRIWRLPPGAQWERRTAEEIWQECDVARTEERAMKLLLLLDPVRPLGDQGPKVSRDEMSLQRTYLNGMRVLSFSQGSRHTPGKFTKMETNKSPVRPPGS